METRCRFLVLTLYSKQVLFTAEAVLAIHRSIEQLWPEWLNKLRVAKNDHEEGIVPSEDQASFLEAWQEASPPMRWGATRAILRGNSEDFIIYLKSERSKMTNGNILSAEISWPSSYPHGKTEDFARNLLKRLAHGLDAIYGRICCTDEFETKNILTGNGSTKAIGIDLDTCLPGLYWVNYFGADMGLSIAKEATRDLPIDVEDIRSGVMISISPSPADWQSTEYVQVEQEVTKLIGEERFFKRA